MLFLGTGGSAGVPMIGCTCSVCLSLFPEDRRTRSAALLQVQGKKILIDAGPDLREQALKWNISHIDALLLTHAHADHIGGMDDLRAFYFLTKQKLPCFLSQETLCEVKQRYHYFFTPPVPNASMPAQIDFFPFDHDSGRFHVEGIEICYFSYLQNGMKVTGFRIGTLAYVSDIKEYPETIFDHLKGVEVLIVSALRHSKSQMHFTVQEAIEFSKKVGAKRTFLTHISHELAHRETNALLPPDIQLGFDGLTVEWH